MTDKKSKLTLAKLNKADFVKGKHVLIVESPESRRAVSLNANVFSIGRHPHNDLIINDPLASRHHATVAWMEYTEELSQSDYSYWIIDGKGKRQRSRNGIIINGKKKFLHRLVSGDIVNIGNGIKISYNFITFSTESSQFLDHCEGDKAAFRPNNVPGQSSKKTVLLDETVVKE